MREARDEALVRLSLLFLLVKPVSIVKPVVRVAAVVAAEESSLDRGNKESFYDPKQQAAEDHQDLFRRRPVSHEEIFDIFPDVFHNVSLLICPFCKRPFS